MKFFGGTILQGGRNFHFPVDFFERALQQCLWLRQFSRLMWYACTMYS